ncbi:MAG: KH domain-containing protein [Clostridiales bacterium]|nr:KH domain-containing protein [Clostridiales bacterium]MDD7432941.1 KH domain-containing protein [Clostridiales bacterium]MDY3062302.1 KH domain-containing protein [Eubacteriales bacterium]
MEELLKTLVEPLVEHPEDIEINCSQSRSGTVLELRVNPEDMGRVIGRGGRRAQAIRSIMKAKGNTLGERILVDIVE